jgi:hypothetical protein
MRELEEVGRVLPELGGMVAAQADVEKRLQSSGSRSNGWTGRPPHGDDCGPPSCSQWRRIAPVASPTTFTSAHEDATPGAIWAVALPNVT